MSTRTTNEMADGFSSDDLQQTRPYDHLDALNLVGPNVGSTIRKLNGANTDTEPPAQQGSYQMTAFTTRGQAVKIIPAFEGRAWMDHAHTAFANRCLPMRMAGQSGWFLLNSSAIEVTWNGGSKQRDLTIRQLSNNVNTAALSHFGHGVLTWWLPFLFRTPPGFNMHIRGPANWCKDGVCPLDAIVETDWAVASFPMSWKFTRVGTPIVFEKDEPICMISPLRRGEIERFEPVIRSLREDAELQTGFEAWSASRKEFNASLLDPDHELKWQKHYFLGTHPASGEIFAEHQVRLDVKPFADTRSTSPAEGSGSATQTHQAPLSMPISCPFGSSTSQLAQPTAPRTEEPSVVKDFFAGAHSLRQSIERCFGPTIERNDLRPNAWQLLFWEGQTPFLRALAADIIPQEQLAAFRERLVAWCAEHLPGHIPASPYLTLLFPSSRLDNVTSAASKSIRYFYVLCDEGAESRLTLQSQNQARATYSSPLKRLRPHRNEIVTPEFNDFILINGSQQSFILDGSSPSKVLPGFLFIEGALLPA